MMDSVISNTDFVLKCFEITAHLHAFAASACDFPNSGKKIKCENLTKAWLGQRSFARDGQSAQACLRFLNHRAGCFNTLANKATSANLKSKI
jgi:hypothetical protein